MPDAVMWPASAELDFEDEDEVEPLADVLWPEPPHAAKVRAESAESEKPTNFRRSIKDITILLCLCMRNAHTV